MFVNNLDRYNSYHDEDQFVSDLHEVVDAFRVDIIDAYKVIETVDQGETDLSDLKRSVDKILEDLADIGNNELNLALEREEKDLLEFQHREDMLNKTYGDSNSV